MESKDLRELTMQVYKGRAFQTDGKQVQRFIKQGTIGDITYMKKENDIIKKKIQ